MRRGMLQCTRPCYAPAFSKRSYMASSQSTQTQSRNRRVPPPIPCGGSLAPQADKRNTNEQDNFCFRTKVRVIFSNGCRNLFGRFVVIVKAEEPSLKNG